MEHKAVIASLGALAQETRLDVYRLLVEQGPAGLPAGVIAEALSLHAATLSFHLKALKHAGIVRSTRSGRTIVYAADFQHMGELLKFLTKNCCRGAAIPMFPSKEKTHALTTGAQCEKSSTSN